jgi:hypothetical protein
MRELFKYFIWTCITSIFALVVVHIALSLIKEVMLSLQELMK